MRRSLPWLLATAYVAGVLALVLTPISWALNRLTVRLYVLWLYDLRLPGRPSPETFGTALNVLLFVPVGFALVRLARLPWWAAALACVAGSAAIEAAQTWLVSGREASVGDVVANGAGGLVGALLAAWLLRRRPPAHRLG